ncbi:unnamed protein product [Arabidopsis thaliana]|uniref:(thale cress) hypothetical protein n=1 Tax=Arabidopsis thaliana TaxID=3702 RepID=A0A7G2ESC7_ARATH|nr:unnamed protein product [Arabidopsis thaliana]
MSSSTDDAGTTTHSLQEFKLFETQSNFYMIGWDGSGVYRVLKIDRLDPSELNISQDSTHYTKKECYELLKRIHEGNKATGGLKLVTLCYGFVKFLGPYYMLLITERRHIGDLFGHSVYAVSKSEIVALHNSTVQCNFANSRDENRFFEIFCVIFTVFLCSPRIRKCRYKRLLCMVDLTKDFFFSYSYNVMRSYQKNVCNYETGHNLYEKMFVWNEFLTRGIRHHLRNTLWTVALVYGFFKQASLSESGKDFKITLIARRSRHNAGTRYLKRGVNRNGDVANDVETEQIVSEDVPEDHPMQISSVVQNRGSIPLFWSQETSRLNLKPDIVLSKKEPNYEATRLHFDNLVERYGNPIIILNLIKTKERRPRESILREEFVNAIDFINKDLPEENRLRFLHWDLHKHFRSKTKNVLALLCKVATCALMLTDLFYYQVTPAMKIEDSMSLSSSSDADTGDISPHTSSDDDNGDHDSLEKKSSRTQYAYGWAALGQQLHVLGIRDVPAIELDDPLAISLMGLYERMGDTLAHQYGGSAAHNKVFSERRGQWRAATQSQEFLRTLQRYYNNAYMDADKQDAINIFLGTFQPEQGMPAIWELRSNSLSNGRNGEMNIGKDERFLVKRCLSDGDFLHESCTPLSAMSSNHESMPQKALSRCTPSMPRKQLFGDVQKVHRFGSDQVYFGGEEDMSSVSNFVDIEWLSSENPCENALFDRSSELTRNLTAETSSTENSVNGVGQSAPTISESGSSSSKGKEPMGTKIREDFPDSFKEWVAYGEALCH